MLVQWPSNLIHQGLIVDHASGDVNIPRHMHCLSCFVLMWLYRQPLKDVLKVLKLFTHFFTKKTEAIVLLSQYHWSNFEGYRHIKQNTAKHDKVRTHFYACTERFKLSPHDTLLYLVSNKLIKNIHARTRLMRRILCCYLCTIFLLHLCYGEWCRGWSQRSHTAVCGLVLRF